MTLSSRRAASFLLTAFWALIYLPGLGSTEIKGEEGRRILPAVTMLDEGNWLVPHVGGKPFLRKPPLMNWLIAGSFKLTGVRNEWTARLPSALLVLALGLTIVGCSGPKRLMSVPAGFTAALFAMTQFGLLAKARFAGAEIEGAYVPLCGIAFVTWLACWFERKPSFVTWTLPFVFLGLATLTKGPLHFLFFYTIVIAVLWHAGRLRDLLAPWHFVGLAISGAIFAAWAVPYFRTEEALKAATVWRDQFAGRVTGNVFHWRSYLLNIPRALADELPVLLLAPVLAKRCAPLPKHSRGGAPATLDDVTPALLSALAICFFGMLLVPGVLPRYLLPLGVPLCMLVAARLSEGEGAAETGAMLCRWQFVNRALAVALIFIALLAPIMGSVDVGQWLVARKIGGIDLAAAAHIAIGSTMVIAICALVAARRIQRLTPVQCVLASGALLASASILFSTAARPWLRARETSRPLAAEIDATIAATAAPGTQVRLILFDPGWWPSIFYLRTPYRYAANVKDIPRGAEFVIARAENAQERKEQLEKFARRRPDLELVRGFADPDGTEEGAEFLLLRGRGPIFENGGVK
jgi:4-amino-4-deoxy-L-arabinose transferase-like glycosyltransferase